MHANFQGSSFKTEAICWSVCVCVCVSVCVCVYVCLSLSIERLTIYREQGLLMLYVEVFGSLKEVDPIYGF